MGVDPTNYLTMLLSVLPLGRLVPASFLNSLRDQAGQGTCTTTWWCDLDPREICKKKLTETDMLNMMDMPHTLRDGTRVADFDVVFWTRVADFDVVF